MVSPSFIYTFSWGNVSIPEQLKSIDIFINTLTEKRIFALSIIIYFYINKLYGIFIYIKINLTCTEKRIFAQKGIKHCFGLIWRPKVMSLKCTQNPLGGTRRQKKPTFTPLNIFQKSLFN